VAVAALIFWIFAKVIGRGLRLIVKSIVSNDFGEEQKEVKLQCCNWDMVAIYKRLAFKYLMNYFLYRKWNQPSM
jgi:hypothetical protein